VRILRGIKVATEPQRPANKLKGGLPCRETTTDPKLMIFARQGGKRERVNSSRDWGRGNGIDWQTRASIRLKLQKVRENHTQRLHAIPEAQRRAVDKMAEVSFTNVHNISVATENEKVN
jgi:hypothetical protein